MESNYGQLATITLQCCKQPTFVLSNSLQAVDYKQAQYRTSTQPCQAPWHILTTYPFPSCRADSCITAYIDGENKIPPRHSCPLSTQNEPGDGVLVSSCCIRSTRKSWSEISEKMGWLLERGERGRCTCVRKGRRGIDCFVRSHNPTTGPMPLSS